MSSVQPVTSTVPPRSHARRLVRTALLLCGVTLLTAVSWGGYRLWNGAPYPEVDPNVVGTRLREEAERVHEDLALPGPAAEGPYRVETGACYYRGLRGFAHIDRSRRDVYSFDLDTRTTGVPQATARTGEERVRSRLSQQGWKLISENISDMGFRFEDPDTGDMVDVNWYEPTGTLAVSVFSQCGKVPDGFAG
ncbi:hypothetical protein PV721_09455 [Streptomyces sp. MB09-01]|uniref:hypothetical protein n=1 Tax=Streptomyces sp. MB09-01 TaxID=3028666 RepID=UPI0029A8B351|nr:hypothetical protein [Streptomyces sp. MB09-01]MDX3534592.1 hypothetical protein [Streptomyces sp. MB09-01]